MLQKVIQIGNSIGVIIPSELRKALNIKKGSNIYMEKMLDGDIRFSKSEKKNTSSASNEEVINALSRVNKRYGSALRKLAKL